MTTPDAPTSQKKVMTGEAIHSIGRPMTKRPVYRCFCVMVCSPNCTGSAAGERVSKQMLSQEDNQPNLLMAAKPPTKKTMAMSRMGLLMRA